MGPGRRWLLFTLQPRGPVLGGERQQELKIPRAPGPGLAQCTPWSQTPAPRHSLISPFVGCVPSAGSSTSLLQLPFLQPAGVVGELIHMQGAQSSPVLHCCSTKGRICLWESRAQRDSFLENPHWLCRVQLPHTIAISVCGPPSSEAISPSLA